MSGPPFVGLTGGIAAGKSEALAALARLGASVLSTDAVVHALYAEPAVRDAVVARWGPAVAPRGVVSRPAVAQRALPDPRERAWLEGLLWPLVQERTAAWRAAEAACQPPPRALVVEVPLLFEGGLEDRFDATVAIVAPDALRDARARARGHAAVDERAARQLAQEEKAARATYVIENAGGLGALEAELSTLLDKLEAVR